MFRFLLYENCFAADSLQRVLAQEKKIHERTIFVKRGMGKDGAPFDTCGQDALHQKLDHHHCAVEIRR